MKHAIAPCGALIGALLLLGASSAKADEAAMDAAKAVVAAHSTMPAFEAPGPAFDAKKCMAGKKLLSVPTSSAIPFVDGIETSMEKVAKQVGFTFQQWKNQARPTQWVQGMDYAVNNKFDGVDLFGGIIPRSLSPQVAAADKAGVKVFASHYSDVTQPADPGVAVTLKVPFTTVGEILGSWVAVKTGGKANVLIIGSDDILPSRPYAEKIASTLDAACGGGCKHRYVNVPVAEWSTKIQPSVQSAMIADPTINYILPLYDSMAQFVLPALTITGHRKDVKIATFNGTPFIVDMVQKGDVEMDVGESIGWIARSTLDGYMRNFCGMASPDHLNVPLYIFDAHNAKDAGVPASFDQGYGDTDVAAFDKLWGLQ